MVRGQKTQSSKPEIQCRYKDPNRVKGGEWEEGGEKRRNKKEGLWEGKQFYLCLINWYTIISAKRNSEQ